jgi:hypothetical protein
VSRVRAAALGLLALTLLVGAPDALADRPEGDPLAGSDPRSCAGAVVAGIASFDLSDSAPPEALRCPASGMVIVRLRPDGAAPLDVEIRRGAEGAFREAGEYGLSPLLNVPDFDAVPAPQRRAFEALVAAVAADGLTLGSVVPVPAALRSRRAPWLLAAALLALAAAALARRRQRSAPDDAPEQTRGHAGLLARPGWALFGLAIVARLLGGAWGPWHINGHGPAWLLRTWLNNDPMPGYGPGYPELLTLPVRALPLAPDHAVFVTNLLLGAAVAPLLFRLGRELGLGAVAASLAGLVAALDPLSLRFAATEAYHPSMLAGRHAAELLLLLAVVSIARRSKIEGVLLGLAGLLVACQAARVHPMAWPLICSTPLVLLAWDAGGSPRQRLVRPVVACLAVGALLAAVLLLTGTISPAEIERISTTRPLSGASGWQRLVQGLGRRPLGWIALLTALLIVRGGAARRLATPAAASALLIGATFLIFTQTGYWLDSYLRLGAGLPLLAVAALLPAAVERLPIDRRALVPIGVAALAAIVAARAAPATTEQQEYRWLRERLVELEAGCDLRWVEESGKRGMSVPWHLIPDAPMPMKIHSGEDLIAGFGPTTCRLYLHGSLCSSTEVRPLCDAIERTVALEELDRALLDALPSYDDHPYDRDPVEVILYRVR